MKRFFVTIVMVLGFMVTAGAMSYSQAREQALFLTDKMAYELNLTDDQYEAAYENKPRLSAQRQLVRRAVRRLLALA